MICPRLFQKAASKKFFKKSFKTVLKYFAYFSAQNALCKYFQNKGLVKFVADKKLPVPEECEYFL